MIYSMPLKDTIIRVPEAEEKKKGAESLFK